MYQCPRVGHRSFSLEDSVGIGCSVFLNYRLGKIGGVVLRPFQGQLIMRIGLRLEQVGVGVVRDGYCFNPLDLRPINHDPPLFGTLL